MFIQTNILCIRRTDIVILDYKPSLCLVYYGFFLNFRLTMILYTVQYLSLKANISGLFSSCDRWWIECVYTNKIFVMAYSINIKKINIC